MPESNEEVAPRKPVTLDEVLNAMRTLWVKLDVVEKKLDDLLTPKGQQAMKMAGKGVSRPANPMHTLLTGRLVGVWSGSKHAKYVFAPRDAAAVRDLLKRSLPMDEVVARWGYAIKNGCDSIFSFEMNFNKWDASQGSNRPVVDGTTDLYAEKPK